MLLAVRVVPALELDNFRLVPRAVGWGGGPYHEKRVSPWPGAMGHGDTAITATGVPHAASWAGAARGDR